MPNPYVILGAVLIAISVYFYGHHKGWVERDFEMQAEIAKKNEESRAKEQEMSTKLNEQSSKLQEANNAIDQKQSALDRAIRAGRVRLAAARRYRRKGYRRKRFKTGAPSGRGGHRPASARP